MHHALSGSARLGALLACALCSSPANAQDRFATSIVHFNQGSGGGAFDPALLLGGPRGGGTGSGSLDVLTLGVGGDVTLGFDVVLTDGPGADFSVFENGLVFSGGVFTETCFVEVSTDGATFARFPVKYDGPSAPIGPFDVLPFGTFAGLAGGAPVQANVDTNSIDPFDPVVSGGEAFDLADLAQEPEVVSGAVDLASIHFVRLVDMVALVDVDGRGRVMQDSGGDSGCDMDALAVIQHAGNQVAAGPVVDAYYDAQGFVHLRIGDPDGLGDLDPITRRISIDQVPMRFERLRRYFDVQSVTSTEIHLVTPQRVGNSGLQFVLAVSVRDRAGNFAADQVIFHR